MTADFPPQGGGIRPVLFEVAGWPVPAYSFFMLLAVLVGLILFWREARRQGAASENLFYVLLGALFGGAIGAKVPIVILDWRVMAAHFPDPGVLLSGRSVLGALVGGALGVAVVKRRLHLTTRTGNLFVPGLAAGMAVGRLGCFLRGCCGGKPTGLPWGVDCGDGIARHPTQLYEALFMAAVLAAGLVAVRRWPDPPGRVFRHFMIVCCTFRFAIEFIRDEPAWLLGLTLFQWICLAVVLFYTLDLCRVRGGERTVIA